MFRYSVSLSSIACIGQIVASVKRCSHCARHRTTALDALTHDVGRRRTTSYDVVRCRAQCEHLA